MRRFTGLQAEAHYWRVLTSTVLSDAILTTTWLYVHNPHNPEKCMRKCVFSAHLGKNGISTRTISFRRLSEFGTAIDNIVEDSSRFLKTIKRGDLKLI